MSEGPFGFGAGGIMIVTTFLLFFIVFIMPTFTFVVKDDSTVVVDDNIEVAGDSTVVVDDSIGIDKCYMFYVSLTSMDGVVFDMEVFREKYKDCNNYADLGLYVNDTLYTFMFEDLINMKKDEK